MEELKQRADQFAADNGLEVFKSLGFGIDGHVWQSNVDTAIKVFERQRNYELELECYQRLSEKKVTEICGFSVPCLVNHSFELLIVEMDMVSAPCVIDFGKAYVDRPPPHNHDWRAIERSQIETEFGDDADKAKEIVFALECLGIYYTDARPSNIRFR